MANKIKSLFVNLLPKKIRDNVRRSYYFFKQRRYQYEHYMNPCFSQEGEDQVLRKLMGKKTGGFYVDVGAHHPYRYSNTFIFYLNGWSGINIDPLPGIMKMFEKRRPRDINLEVAILSDVTKPVTYHVFNDAAINTFDPELATHWEKNTTNLRLIDKISITPRTLSEVLDKHLPKGVQIDFMSIDVEGMEMEVLQSNDWSRFSPRFIVAESLSVYLTDIINLPVSIFLKNKNYRIVSFTPNSIFYSLM